MVGMHVIVSRKKVIFVLLYHVLATTVLLPYCTALSWLLRTLLMAYKRLCVSPCPSHQNNMPKYAVQCHFIAKLYCRHSNILVTNVFALFSNMNTSAINNYCRPCNNAI